MRPGAEASGTVQIANTGTVGAAVKLARTGAPVDVPGAGGGMLSSRARPAGPRRHERAVAGDRLRRQAQRDATASPSATSRRAPTGEFRFVAKMPPGGAADNAFQGAQLQRRLHVDRRRARSPRRRRPRRRRPARPRRRPPARRHNGGGNSGGNNGNGNNGGGGNGGGTTTPPAGVSGPARRRRDARRSGVRDARGHGLRQPAQVRHPRPPAQGRHVQAGHDHGQPQDEGQGQGPQGAQAQDDR